MTKEHRLTVGDTLTPLTAQLKQRDSTGVLSSVNLTGKSVTVRGEKSDNTAWIAETSTGVSITDAANGLVQYSFQSADVITAGIFWIYFVVTSAGKRDTFPREEKKLAVVIAPKHP